MIGFICHTNVQCVTVGIAIDRDTLQSVIALLKRSDFGIDMQFTNYRTN